MLKAFPSLTPSMYPAPFLDILISFTTPTSRTRSWFCSIFSGPAVTCPAAATTCPSPPARFYEPELNSVSGSWFAGSVWCLEFLGGRSESNVDAQENTQGVRDACYRQQKSQRITPSHAVILFFAPLWSALPQRNEIINSVIIQL